MHDTFWIELFFFAVAAIVSTFAKGLIRGVGIVCALIAVVGMIFFRGATTDVTKPPAASNPPPKCANYVSGNNSGKLTNDCAN